MNLRAEARENIGQEVVVVEACLVRSVVSTKNQAVVWILRTSACDVMQEITKAVEGCACDVLTGDAPLPPVHQYGRQLEPISLRELNGSLRLVVRLEVLRLLVLLARQVLVVVREAVESVPIGLARHMHLKYGLQVGEEVVGDEPSVEELISLNQVYEQLEVGHVVILLRRHVFVVHNYFGVQDLLRQEAHQLRDEHLQLLARHVQREEVEYE